MTVQSPRAARSADEQPAQHAPRCERPRHRFRRPLAVLVAVGGVSLLGTGAFASWQATGQASSAALSAATGALTIADASAGRLVVAVPNMVPNDFLYRYVDITNTSTVPVTVTQALTASGTLSPALKATVDVCPGVWNTTSAACTGTSSQVATGTLGSALALGTPSLAAGAVQHVRIKVELPSATDASYMGKTATLTLTSSGDLTSLGDRTGA